MKLYMCYFLISVITSTYAVPPEARIAGGEQTTIERHPYHVSLMENHDEHICGGALLNDYWIITSAKCVNEYRTLAGLNIRVASSELQSGGNIYPALLVFQHGGYHHDDDFVPIADDIALVKCSSSIWDEETGYVTLPAPGQEPPAGSAITVTGFGSVNASMENGKNSTHSEYLREVDVTVWSHAECVGAYGSGVVDENRFCAGDAGKGGCQGDHGSPAVVDGVIYGVLSYTQGCGSDEYPGIFMKISPYLEWINATINMW